MEEEMSLFQRARAHPVERLRPRELRDHWRSCRVASLMAGYTTHHRWGQHCPHCISFGLWLLPYRAKRCKAFAGVTQSVALGWIFFDHKDQGPVPAHLFSHCQCLSSTVLGSVGGHGKGSGLTTCPLSHPSIPTLK